MRQEFQPLMSQHVTPLRLADARPLNAYSTMENPSTYTARVCMSKLEQGAYDACPECRKVMRYTPRATAQWYCGKCQAARGEAMVIPTATVVMHDADSPSEKVLEGTAFASIAESFMEHFAKGTLLDVPWLIRVRVSQSTFGASATIERASQC